MAVIIDDDMALELLENRLDKALEWWSSPAYKDLYMQMYQAYINSGVWDETPLDVLQIVDNDIINYTRVITSDDEEYQDLYQLYEQQGLGDISCEHNLNHGWNFIEAVDEINEYILVRM